MQMFLPHISPVAASHSTYVITQAIVANHHVPVQTTSY